MHDGALSTLTQWSNFYVITGSSAAALTGLVFIVITLIAGGRADASGAGISVFSSPTVVHFGVALFVSATLSAPWHELTPACVLIGAAGIFGFGFTLRVVKVARQMRGYEPGVDDWLWYALVPMFSYLGLCASVVWLEFAPGPALFAVAGIVAFLIFIGIHNAWDVVTYIAVDHEDNPEELQTPTSSNLPEETKAPVAT